MSPADVKDSTRLSERRGLSLKAVIAGITTLAALVGAIKTLTAETTGASLTPGHLLFYIGASVIAAYVALAAGAMVGGGAASLVAGVLGIGDTKAGDYVIVAGVVVVAGLMFSLLISAGVLWDYDETDELGRIFISLLGLGLLAVPIYLYSRNSGKG